MEPSTVRPPPDSQTTQLPPVWHGKIIKWIKEGKDSTQIVQEIKTTLHATASHSQIIRFKTQYKLGEAIKEQRPRFERMRLRLDGQEEEMDDLRLQMSHVSVQMDQPETTPEQLTKLKARHIALAREVRALRLEMERLDRAITRYDKVAKDRPADAVDDPEPVPEPVIVEITPIPPRPLRKNELDTDLLTREELGVLLYLSYRGIPDSGIPRIEMPAHIAAAGREFDHAQVALRRGLTAGLSPSSNPAPQPPPRTR